MRRIFACVLLFSCALLLWADLRYVEIGSIGNAPSVRVENIGDLQFLIKHHGIEVGYLLKGKENPSDVRLVVIGDGTYFFFDMNGHLSIEGIIGKSTYRKTDYRRASAESRHCKRLHP